MFRAYWKKAADQAWTEAWSLAPQSSEVCCDAISDGPSRKEMSEEADWFDGPRPIEEWLNIGEERASLTTKSEFSLESRSHLRVWISPNNLVYWFVLTPEDCKVEVIRFYDYRIKRRRPQ
jgi:hypothetical protein